MDTDPKTAKRRAYKTQWQARKRRAIKRARGETVELFLPRQLLADLRQLKPKGASLKQWLVVELRHKVAKTATPTPAAPAAAPINGADRNKPCPCGCGRKVKQCPNT